MFHTVHFRPDHGQWPTPPQKVRCQRLDEWLCCNSHLGITVPVFFADFEASVYGIPKAQFSPIADLQRFFRLGYGDGPAGCLLGFTFSLRRPSQPLVAARLAEADAEITASDVVALVTVEARDRGRRCRVVEQMSFGMEFILFEITPPPPPLLPGAGN